MCAIDSHPRIETERLVLRAPVMADAVRIATLADDFEIARMTTHMPYPYALYDAQAFVERMAGVDGRRQAVFAIEDRDAGVVGMLGFHPQDLLGPEIGYWVGRPHWGRGIASDAVRAALDWAGRAWRKRVVVSGHFADNPASGRVLVKAGFLYTGEVQPRRSAARGQVAPTRMMVWLA